MPFTISNEVKLSSLLALILFNFLFSRVLAHAMKDIDLEIYIKYQLDGYLFNLRRFSVWTKTLEKLILEAFFADDFAIMADRGNDLQIIAEHFADAAKQLELQISLIKIEILLSPASNRPQTKPEITMKKVQQKCMEGFKYLGSTISEYRTLEKVITFRLQISSQALCRLKMRVLQHKDFALATKLMIY